MQAPPRTPRSVGHWLLLLGVWLAGLLVWTFYIALFLAMFFRYLT
jgi:hypothetical protein